MIDTLYSDASIASWIHASNDTAFSADLGTVAFKRGERFVPELPDPRVLHITGRADPSIIKDMHSRAVTPRLGKALGPWIPSNDYFIYSFFDYDDDFFDDDDEM